MDPGETQSKKEREEATQEHFKISVKFNSKSRYKVDLGHTPIPDNKAMAEKRLISTTKKLKEAGRIEEYGQVFEDWLTEGIIVHVREDEINSKANYLPHRAVFKENSTTKVRPVFDASARMKNYLSLNDCLENGPNLLEQIPSVLLKFRMGNIGVISDIKKAFLQIAVKKQDCDSLRFLWWKGDGQQQLRILRHRRVVFGVNCSPYLLAVVINHHLEKAPSHLRETAKKLGGSLYVDNCVALVKDEEELQRFIQESRMNLMSSANFDLRGWEHTISERKEPVEESNMVLGVRWDRFEDELFLDLKITEGIEGAVTKRKILSAVSQIFDPIGFSCPATVLPKILLQECQMMKTDWDAEVPEDVAHKLRKWVGELSSLAEMRIPRQLPLRDSSKQNWTFHLFCDASKLAYAAVIFLRSEARGEVKVQLVQAKSRVSPLKKLTIPRLELMACTLGSRLLLSVLASSKFDGVQCHYWNDSTTVLCWITREDNWGVFVRNRVKEIRGLTNSSSWKHVPGELNPADLPSRGCSASTLLASKWWEGPSWLRKGPEEWLSSEVQANEDEVNEPN